MGTPKYFDNNGFGNFNYTYDDIEFLGMNGTLEVHFELNMVDSLRFEIDWVSKSDYEEAVEYYTKKYGKPIDTSDYYSDPARTWWELDDGTYLTVEYYAGSRYGSSELQIEIFV